MPDRTRFPQVLTPSPELAGYHYNLGVRHFSQGNFAQAALSYLEAATINPGDPDIFFNLALTMKEMGYLEEAKEYYEKVLSLTPDDPDTHYNLGVLLKEMAAPEQAISSFEKVIALDPYYLSAHKYLAGLFQQTGRKDQALASYRKVIEINPASESAQHMLEALEGKTTVTCPLAYSKELFDQFSDHFDDAMLTKLACTIPAQLRLVMDDFPSENFFDNGLDMGCGTGLSGLAFRDCVTHFTGIDLSGKMLAKALEKEVYTTLDENDILSFLDKTAETFDFFLAADVFIYLADLTPIFGLIRKKARIHASFLFSTEICAENYCLQTSGRYAQAESYINALADNCDFKVYCRHRVNLRKEKNKWIKGNLFLLTA
ncbi:MAG: tetratricopeptide repeat protein [Proteobacteria bacterium]|nr:tetratricopeptide repeat protein [Pseudomonadota bacterium]